MTKKREANKTGCNKNINISENFHFSSPGSEFCMEIYISLFAFLYQLLSTVS